MSNKCVIYLDGVSRGIVLTDHDHTSIEELTKNISTSMAGNSIFELKTKTDTLIVRPSQISAVHIQGGPKVGNAKPKKSKEQSIKDIVPELDLGDDLDNVVESIKDDLASTIDEKTDDEEKETLPVVEVIEEDNIIDEKMIVDDPVDEVISEVEAWHSEIDKDE